MKILYLSRSLLPSKAANSVHVMKMCQALAKNGHDVTLVASCREKSSLEAIYDYYGVNSNFKIMALKGNSDKITGLILYLFNFYRFIRKVTRPDLLYGRDLFTLSMATKVMKIPFYYESHKPPTSIVHSVLTRRLINNKHLVELVVITKSLKNEYLRLFPGLLDQKMLVAPDGADLPTGKKANIDNKKSDRICIGYVGHLYPGRGIEIIKELAEAFPRCEFHLVGGTENDVTLWRNKCHGMKNISFKGYVPPKELPRYYHCMDIVLAPYQSKVAIHGGGGDTVRWMSPLKIFEYMAFAKPIIASNLPVLKEVLLHGHNAFLCKPHCLAEWADAVKLLTENKDLRDKIAENAFDCLKEHYTWAKRATRILQKI